MGLFSKKKKNDFFQMTEETEKTVKKSKSVIAPSHMLTADEILSDFSDGKPAENKTNPQNGITPLEAMRQRMLKNVAAENQKKEENNVSPTVQTDKNDSMVDFMSILNTPKNRPSKDDVIKPDKTLLKRCMPYIVDDDGHDVSVSNEPIYQLQSVADILKTNSERTLEELRSKYNIELDDLGRKKKPEDKKAPEATAKAQNVVSQATEPKKVVLPPVTPEPVAQKKVEELPPIKDILLEDDEILVFDDELPQISDIDTRVAPKKNNPTGNTATIRFTPVRDGGANNDYISVSTTTRAIDLTGEFGELSLEQEAEIAETQLEESEFETFETKDNIKNENDGKRVIRKFAILKRRSFLQTVLTGMLLLVMLLFLLPALSNFLITSTGTGMVICTVLLGLGSLVNFDMLLSVKTLFSRRSTTDSPALISTALSLALGITAAVYRENVYEILLLALIILFVRALSLFRKNSAVFGNLKQALSNRPKKAVSLITDEATTFAMVKSAIEGDALVAAPRETEMVDDFMKYSDYSTVLDGKMRVVTLGACGLSAIVALASLALSGGLILALYSAAVIMSVAAAPILFDMDSLPLYSAANRLNKKGAFIAGIAAANRIEMANAAVLSCTDIFPDGTVTMHDMKVLSENNFDETIVRAASLTEAVGSPLASIFKKIAGTNTDYKIPDSDTVKYEDKLGLSGWVDDELLFIGNRTLMQAHGIAVPDVEIDRKILRRGFFPVYLASGDKACALIIVQYDVDPQVVYELRRITGLGVTLLVNNCDPNINEEMICDYIGLYEDSVKIMSNSGVHMYKNAVMPCERCSAPAAFRGNPLNFVSVLNCAARIKSSTKILSVFYIIAASLGAVLFAYVSFLGGNAEPVNPAGILLTHLGAWAVANLLFLFKKP